MQCFTAGSKVYGKDQGSSWREGMLLIVHHMNTCIWEWGMRVFMQERAIIEAQEIIEKAQEIIEKAQTTDDQSHNSSDVTDTPSDKHSIAQ